MRDRFCLAVIYLPVLLNRTELDGIKSRPGHPGHTVVIKQTNKQTSLPQTATCRTLPQKELACESDLNVYM